MKTTDSDKVRGYYASFDEWGRLDSFEGAMEFRRTLDMLAKSLAPGSRILDLGGGPGRYAAELVQMDYRVVLADISPELLQAVRQRFAQLNLEGNIESIDEVNATDLRRYPDASFDAVLALGPFYHLLSKEERKCAASEIHRVLRPGGTSCIAFIPRITGITGLIKRAASTPEQVSPDVLRAVADTGVFQNASDSGFQEGYYPLPGEIAELFQSSGFEVMDEVSLKSIADGLEETVAQLDHPLRVEVDRLVAEMGRQPEVIATSGHVLLVARKTK